MAKNFETVDKNLSPANRQDVAYEAYGAAALRARDAGATSRDEYQGTPRGIGSRPVPPPMDWMQQHNATMKAARQEDWRGRATKNLGDAFNKG